jgi:hypothetical protein
VGEAVGVERVHDQQTGVLRIRAEEQLREQQAHDRGAGVALDAVDACDQHQQPLWAARVQERCGHGQIGARVHSVAMQL